MFFDVEIYVVNNESFHKENTTSFLSKAVSFEMKMQPLALRKTRKNIPVIIRRNSGRNVVNPSSVAQSLSWNVLFIS